MTKKEEEGRSQDLKATTEEEAEAVPQRRNYCHIPSSERANYIIGDIINYKFPPSFPCFREAK